MPSPKDRLQAHWFSHPRAYSKPWRVSSVYECSCCRHCLQARKVLALGQKASKKQCGFCCVWNCNCCRHCLQSRAGNVCILCCACKTSKTYVHPITTIKQSKRPRHTEISLHLQTAHTNLLVITGAIQAEHGAVGVTACRPRQRQLQECCQVHPKRSWCQRVRG